MMQQHNGYWISGTALPGPPYTTYWEALGIALKPGRSGSVIEVGRIQDPGCTFELQELAEIWGLELARMVLEMSFKNLMHRTWWTKSLGE